MPHTVAYLDVEQPFKGFHQVHQVGGLAVLIHDVFGEEQTAYHSMMLIRVVLSAR